ncbi:MAG: hypothetical protein PHF63_11565 [Herbinix sp.]|nr:hypothetical protein [Herbinix sp.]
MLKHVYRVIILIVVFVAALSYFSRDIKEVVFDVDNTTTMEPATFPLVTIKTGENTINLLHGYSSNMDANKVRESVTPLGVDQIFDVLFNKEGLEIKKLNYEVREFVGNSLIETDSVSVFEENGDIQSAKIKLNTELSSAKEYAVKITLITSKTEKIYYYQRIKIYGETYLKNKLDFIMNFHNAIMNKDTAQEVISYLEPSNSADNSTLAYVNINSSFDLVCWGSLKPTVLTDIVPTVKEIYVDTASVELSYYIEAEVAGVMEKYRVIEFYRVRYSQDRMYLLNYERHMESIFDISLANIDKNELKLGITSDYEIPYKAGADSSKLAFVRDKELWFYDLENNQITKVFSFRKKDVDYLRDLYDQHDIRILSMDAEGNIDFLVYGYMNRGQYEGRVAVNLYRYIRGEGRIEELVYIPVDEPYQSLKENLGNLTYLNSKGIFYFQVYDTIYSYDLTTRKLSEIASNINQNQVVVLQDINYVAWQENADLKKSKNINIMDLETGNTQTIRADDGYNIRLMDMIDSNIIYGFVKENDIAAMIDGSIMVPLSKVLIASVNKTVLKSYSVPGYYVTGLTVKENVIELRRVHMASQEGQTIYSYDQDQIMNQKKTEASLIGITSSVSDQALTEYYMTLPSGFLMEKKPKVLTTVNTVITQDPTVRISETEQSMLYYYPYITGGIEGAYENAADAINVARENIGVVLNSDQELVWERGVKAANYTISGFEAMNWTPSGGDTVASCIKLMLSYQGVSTLNKQLSTRNSSAYYVLKTYSKYTPVRLTGITLDDALYYVSKGRPVIAMTDSGNGVIIYGYDTFNIMVIDPTKSSISKIGIQDSAKMFEDAGNVFLSYLED